MTIKFSEKKVGVIGIAGHVGCGHSHSLNNQAQDDSAGLAVVLKLLQEATGISLKIKDFEFEGNKIIAIMENGGKGFGVARRGISVQEKAMVRGIIGKEAINTHTLVLDAFGRIYGQGILEAPVAVQTAIANAALDGFLVNYPERFISTVEDIGSNIGNIIGTVLEIDGIDVSVMGTVNATSGGLGPNEDLEGNSPNYSKKAIVEALALDKLPTIIIEAKISSSFSEGLKEDTFFVRADKDDDNIVVMQAILDAAKELKIPMVYREGGGMKRTKDALRNNTIKVGEKIIGLGEKLRDAESSEDKVNIIAELALAVSQDCGGISFMSNDLHEEIGGAGMIRKLGAVINIVVAEDYPETHPIPYLTDEDTDTYTDLVKLSVSKIHENLDEAMEIINN